MPATLVNSVNSRAEDLFVQLFCEAFGPDKAANLYIQHPFVDIYGNHRYIDFALQSDEARIAIEIDGKTYHNPKMISDNKYYDDLLKQNSLIYSELVQRSVRLIRLRCRNQIIGIIYKRRLR